MKKLRIISIFTLLCLALCCGAFYFSACAPQEDNKNTHIHEYTLILESQDKIVHNYVCSCGKIQRSEAHDVLGANDTCSKCGHVHEFGNPDTQGVCFCSICGATKTVHVHKYTNIIESEDKSVHNYVCSCGDIQKSEVHDVFFNGVNYVCTKCGHIHTTKGVEDETSHYLKCTTCNAICDEETHNYVYTSDNKEDKLYCSACGKVQYSISKVLDRQIIDLGITDGNINTTQTATISLDNSIGSVESIKFGNIDLNSTTFNVSKFGKTYGEKEIIITTKTADSRTHTVTLPVLLVTKIIKTKSDLNNFGTWADLYDGVKNDGGGDGYFILGSDIVYNGGFSPVFGNPDVAYSTTSFDSLKGFSGIFDGNGKNIVGLRMVGSSDKNHRVAFITKLSKTGVIKDISFINACVGYRSFVTAGGNGTVENIYVSYSMFGSNLAGNSYAGVDYYTSTFCNAETTAKPYLTVKNCVVDFTQDNGYSKKMRSGEYANVLCSGSINEAERFYNVHVVGATEGMRYITNWTHDVKSTYNYVYATKGASWSYSFTVNDFLTVYGEEIDTWENWSVDNGVVTFFGKKIFEGTPYSLSSGGKLISSDKKSSDYTIVYDAENLNTSEAASFLVKMFYRATGKVELKRYKEDASSVLEGLYYTDNVSDGIILNKTSAAAFNNDICYIVIGNKELIKEAGLTAPSNGALIKKVGNSYYIVCDKEDYYDEAVRIFLNRTIGFDALNDIIINFNVDKAVNNAPDVYFESEIASTARNVSGQLQYVKVDVMGYTSTYYNGEGGPWHNSFNWLPYDNYGTAHPKWYSNTLLSGKPTQLCYSAHGNNTEYNTLVNTVAEKVIGYIKADPTKNRVAFTHQDDNTFCDCSECSKHSPSYWVLKFINAVCDKIDESYSGDYSLNFFGYKKTFESPTDSEFNSIGEINSHVGIILAPIEGYFAKSIYAKENEFFKTHMDRWGTKLDNIGCWFYQTNYQSYFFPYNTFAPMLTWLEYAGRILKTEWIFVQGTSNLRSAPAFHDFKEYANSKAAIEILSKVKAYSSYASDDDYMADINAYLHELEQDFFGIKIVSSVSVRLDTSKKGYFGSAGVDMYKLYLAENEIYDKGLAELKKVVESNYAGYDNKTKGWADIYNNTSETGLGSCRDHIDSMAFYYQTRYKIYRGGNFYLNTGVAYYYTQVYYPYVSKTQISNLYSILKSATKKLSDEYADDFDNVYYDIIYKEITTESLFPRLIACTAINSVSSTNMQELYYTYTYKGQTITETSKTKWQHFKDDADSLFVKTLGENLPNYGVYNSPSNNRAGLYYLWKDKLGFIGSFTNPTWA